MNNLTFDQLRNLHSIAKSQYKKAWNKVIVGSPFWLQRYYEALRIFKIQQRIFNKMTNN